ncbi:transposase (plasmid) [Leifsonia sp. ZF2019]|nr:transposase [Leifsonia sp. ZF2019]
MVFQVVVVAVGVAADGRPEVLGFKVGETESQPFWTTFLRSVKARGLGGEKLVISDAHTGLIATIQTVFAGAAWQRWPRSLNAQRPRERPEDRRAHGRLDHPHDLRPTRHRTCDRPVRGGHPDSGTLTPEDRGHARSRPR